MLSPVRVPLDTLLLILIFTDDEKRTENNNSSNRRVEAPKETHELAKRGAQVVYLYVDDCLRWKKDTISPI